MLALFSKIAKHMEHVNQDVVRTEMAYLQEHSMIVNFVGEKPSLSRTMFGLLI